MKRTSLPLLGWMAPLRHRRALHKFHVGESVILATAISRNVPGGIYQVTKQLPHNGREFEYHIKSANEDHQRVVRESELIKA